MPAPLRTTVQRLLLGAVLTLVLCLLVLAGSGVVLARSYKPHSPGVEAAFADGDPFRGIDRAQRLHRIATVGAGIASLAVTAFAVAVVLERRRSASTRPGVAAASRLAVPAAVTIPALVLGATFTGVLLPWDQVAITEVTVGESYDGVLVAFRDDVRFFLVAGGEVGVATYRRWVIAHLGLLPALLVAVVALVARLTRATVTELQ